MEIFSFSPQPHIAVIGLGYVGLPLTLAFNHQYKEVGFDAFKTLCIQTSEHRVVYDLKGVLPKDCSDKRL
tara:strand:- start:255 stop:464 length:210 start_codon:yes stop_codon:yes gene_type:complete